MYLLFDIGGSHTRISVSEDGVNIGRPLIIDTPQDFNQGMSTIQVNVKQLIGENKIVAGAGGIAGVLNRRKDEYIRGPHLPGWEGKPLKKSLSEIAGCDVFLENDTAMVGLGEAHNGGGRGFNIVAYVTISTGVGGVRIVNGRIDTNIFGFEPGHQIIDADGSICPDCGYGEDGIDGPGSLEALIAGSSLSKRYKVPAHEINNDEIWEAVNKHLAVGLHNTIVHWSPDVVVIGGGLVKNPGVSVEEVREHVNETLKIFPIKPDIKSSELGDLGGLYGSLAYLKNLNPANN